MANAERRLGESEQSFRARQKRDEVEEYLAIAGNSVDEFLKSPLWKKNAKGNLVFNSILTIHQPFGGTFSDVIGGGRAIHSQENYETEEEAQRALWDAMQKILE